MTRKPVPNIGDKHRRGISITLVLLDQALCEFEQWARGRQAQSVLYEETNDLSPGQRERVLAEVAEIRVVLRELRDTLRLEGEIQSAAGAIWRASLGLWEHLAELEGKHLKRYGTPPAGLAEYLKPMVQQLEAGLERIRVIVGGKATE